MIYFTSDTHYDHRNICIASTRWPDTSSCRKFKSLEEMNNALVININSVVKQDDELYHLGDWSFASKDNIIKFRERLICKNVHLIYGNHDEHIIEDPDKYAPYFASMGHYKEIKVNGQMIILSHFAMRVWNKCGKGAWMLHGHSHGSLQPYKQESTGKLYKTIDVGIDANPDFRPYSITELHKIMEDRVSVNDVDHHRGQDEVR